jgi:hypothetical protein
MDGGENTDRVSFGILPDTASQSVTSPESLAPQREAVRWAIDAVASPMSAHASLGPAIRPISGSVDNDDNGGDQTAQHDPKIFRPRCEA